MAKCHIKNNKYFVNEKSFFLTFYITRSTPTNVGICTFTPRKHSPFYTAK